MPGDFGTRMRELSLLVGPGPLQALVGFDEPYAHRQHEDLRFKHIHGGGPKFLEKALFENIPVTMEIIAKNGFLDLPRGVAVAGEYVATEARRNAPKRPEAGNLEHSDYVTVMDRGVPVYHRPSSRPYLSKEDIKRINEAVQTDPHHWYGAWPATPEGLALARVWAARGRRAQGRR